ncbi:MAG: IS630 family transposase [Okeania sp. SIO2H7]|nr:IS630 family transposase [Okeania sp. SIO2H7]
MSGRPKIEIIESVETLKSLMKKQKRILEHNKILTLYLLKSGEQKTVRGVARNLGRGETTIHRWLKLYREGGMENLLQNRQTVGRPKKFSAETVAIIQKELRDPEGFSSYKEIDFWLKIVREVPSSYAAVYYLVKKELKSKLKVPRPRSISQKSSDINRWKNNLKNKLDCLLAKASGLVKKFKKVSFWCFDETRIGLHTITRRKITLFGVKPEGKKQMSFEYFWLYGAVEPRGGRSFFFEFCHLDTICFEAYLKQFSQAYPQELLIVQVDNARSHSSAQLELPENVILLFQPPYCPEVNPIERFWEYVKEFLAWDVFSNLEELRTKVEKILTSLTNQVVGLLTGCSWILRALSLP